MITPTFNEGAPPEENSSLFTEHQVGGESVNRQKGVAVAAVARKGWQDLVATIRNPIAEAWDFLTRTPLSTTPTNYPLRGELDTISRGGTTHDRWQHKPTAKGTAHIWFYVHERTVFLEQIHTSHPNETK